MFVPSVMSSCPVGTTGTLVVVLVLGRLADVLLQLLLLSPLDMLLLLLLLLLLLSSVVVEVVNETAKMAGG